MSESITESKTHRIPTAAELGIDLEALRKKYAEERERRLRSDGNRQYPRISIFSVNYQFDKMRQTR